jgi:hypothetical protein
MIYVLLILFFICLFLYWNSFVKNRKVENNNYLTICKVKSNSLTLQISIQESAKYISHIEKRRQGNELYVDVFTTTILNPIAGNKKNFVEIKNFDGIKVVVFLNKKYVIDSLSFCNPN